jgi:Protein of unknown function (DUF1826)
MLYSNIQPEFDEPPVPQRAPAATVGSAAVLCDSAAVFEHIFDEAVALCIWNRAPDPILTDYLECLARLAPWERLARIRVREPNFGELLAGLEPAVGRIRLVTELTGLVDLFATLTDTEVVGVRITATKCRECPRFHVDRVGLRLLCTWLGEGTEWLAHEDVIRGRLSHQPAEVERSGAIIQRMQPFAVAVLKGEQWPGNAGRGAVHRSPDPRGSRVYVSLDAS